MNFPAVLTRLFSRSVAKEQTLSAIESYSRGWFGVIREPFGGAWQQGIVLDGTGDLLKFSGIFAPLTIIVADISKMRPKLIVEDDSGICTEVRNSPYYRVLKRPNHYQNRIQFIAQWLMSKLIHGNTYALKVRDALGVYKLYILDAQRVTPLVSESGDVFYQLSTDHLAGVEQAVIVPAREIIHDRFNCLWHPLIGVSPLYSAAASATMGRKIQAYGAKFFQNMSRPSGVLSAPGTIKDETAKRLKDHWEANYTGENIGKLAVLGDGLKYEAMTIPAEQAQQLQQLEWSTRDSAAAFHVPLFKVGGPIPPNNTIEALNQIYYSDCLQSLIEDFELCMDEGLGLPAGYYTELDIESLLRMDTAAQVDALNKAVGGGWMAPNEARAKRNLGPVAGGGSPYLQQQNFSLAALAKRDALANPFVLDKPTSNPTPSADGPPVTADPAAKTLTYLERRARAAEFALAAVAKAQQTAEATQ